MCTESSVILCIKCIGIQYNGHKYDICFAKNMPMANRPIVFIGGFLDSTAPTLLLNTRVTCTTSTTALSTPSWPLLIWPHQHLLGPFYVIWPLLHLLGPSTMALLHLPHFTHCAFLKRKAFMLRVLKNAMCSCCVLKSAKHSD